MSSYRRCFTESPFMSTADPGRVHHERRWTLDWLLLNRRQASSAYAELLECFEMLTPDLAAEDHFEGLWWSEEAKVIQARDKIQSLVEWRDRLAPHDPYCYLATIH